LAGSYDQAIGIISLFTLVILLLSWLIKYPDRLSSSAVLTTQNPVIEIMPKTTGLLDTIIIHDNEVVSRNTILATIEDAANVEDVFKLKAFVEQFQPTDMAILP
jgi:multidrug resistance efflux pump